MPDDAEMAKASFSLVLLNRSAVSWCLTQLTLRRSRLGRNRGVWSTLRHFPAPSPGTWRATELNFGASTTIFEKMTVQKRGERKRQHLPLGEERRRSLPQTRRAPGRTEGNQAQPT